MIFITFETSVKVCFFTKLFRCHVFWNKCAVSSSCKYLMCSLYDCSIRSRLGNIPNGKSFFVLFLNYQFPLTNRKKLLIFYWFSNDMYSLRDCKRNFKWPSMERCRQCPFYNGTLETFFLINNKLDIHVLVSLNCLFLFVISLRNWLAVAHSLWSNGETRRKQNTFRV